MVFLRSIALATTLVVGIFLALPLKAQTTATLNVSARVVEECTVRSKRELFKLARRLNDPDIIRRCSKGVVSRIHHGVVKIAKVQPRVGLVPSVSRQRIKRSSPVGTTDVVLVTVTY